MVIFRICFHGCLLDKFVAKKAFLSKVHELFPLTVFSLKREQCNTCCEKYLKSQLPLLHGVH